MLHEKKTGETTSKLKQRFQLEIRKNFFTMRIVKHWSRLARKVLQFPSLEVFRAQLVETLCNLIDLAGKPELFYDSKMFGEFHFHPALVSNLADVYNFSYFLYFLFCFLFIKEIGKRP